MTIHIINGPNLNLLGRREPAVYGHRSFEDYFEELKAKYPLHTLYYYQSNHEGLLIDYLQAIGFDADGIILNAGGLTHTSIALADVVSAITSKTVEVHISNIYAREVFRHHSYLSARCVGCIAGLGLAGYELALRYFIEAE